MKKVAENSLIVNIVNQSACSGCHAKSACTVADYQDKDASKILNRKASIQYIVMSFIGFKKNK